MAGMQESLLLSTRDLMETKRAKREAFPYRGLTFASSSSLRRRWIWILSLVGTFLMPCNSTKAALQPTSFHWGRLGHILHPSHQLQRVLCFHTGSVPRGLGVAPQEGCPQCNA